MRFKGIVGLLNGFTAQNCNAFEGWMKGQGEIFALA
jgi:hypothetical protein